MATGASLSPTAGTRLRHRTDKIVESGSPFPLGAALDENGVNFAIYSKNATEVFLLLFDTPERRPTSSNSSPGTN